MKVYLIVNTLTLRTLKIGGVKISLFQRVTGISKCGIFFNKYSLKSGIINALDFESQKQMYMREITIGEPLRQQLKM